MKPGALNPKASRGFDAVNYVIVDRANDPVASSCLPIVCLSHLRWNFVYQRPQHLLSRFARDRPVVYFEEPVEESIHAPYTEERITSSGVRVVVPHIPEKLCEEHRQNDQRQLLTSVLSKLGFDRFVLWVYTPMGMAFAQHLEPAAIVYDCMDELTAFRGAPKAMVAFERDLIHRATLLFTGGRSLYRSKRKHHTSVFEFPSAVDVEHFGQARLALAEPDDQKDIPHPRLGFYGVLDERFDADLLQAAAALRPHWHFVVLGPVAKISMSDLPSAPNIHYLGSKAYSELPHYLSGWDVALLLFARNEATRFISPTKTPEYLAAGKPVVSTSICDVVATYGACRAVRIADEPDAFCDACEQAMDDLEGDPASLMRACDTAIAGKSWDRTWTQMDALLGRATAAALLGSALPTPIREGRAA